MMLSKEESQQYSRHLLMAEVGEEGQEKLKSAKVLVVGTGGLGCPVLQYLAAAGVGVIGIVDDDVVSKSNLQRQILFTHADIGQPKVKVAKKRLLAINPYIEVNDYQEKLTTENALRLFEEYHIIVDGSDNFPTRYLVNDAAVLTNKPVVFGSIFKFDGQVSVFNFRGGPTYRCLYPNPPKSEDVPNCSEVGVLGVLPGVIGSLQANEVLKMVLEIGEVLSGKLLLFDALSMQQSILSISKNDNIEVVELEKDYAFFCNLLGNEEEIEFNQLQSKIIDFQLIDVRQLNERLICDLGGEHIPLNDLEERFTEIEISKPVVFYCQSGVRSKQALITAKRLNPKGEFYSLKGGVNAAV